VGNQQLGIGNLHFEEKLDFRLNGPFNLRRLFHIVLKQNNRKGLLQWVFLYEFRLPRGNPWPVDASVKHASAASA
jgi:hypothetical protein